jgi:hypothetical protein
MVTEGVRNKRELNTRNHPTFGSGRGRDVLKIAGRNHLRALRRMEKVAAELQRTEIPLVTEPKLSS